MLAGFYRNTHNILAPKMNRYEPEIFREISPIISFFCKKKKKEFEIYSSTAQKSLNAFITE